MIATTLHTSLLPLQGGVNFRDQGGYRAAEGRKVKYGVLFRSGALDELTDADSDYLTQLPITHIIDYRDTDEQQGKPDVVWHGADYKNIPANPKDTVLNANLAKITSEQFEQFDPQAFMLGLYERLPFDNQAYQYLVQTIQHSATQGVVQHCAVGKDRTGVGAAIVLFALGADYNTVMEDYLLTELTLQPYRQKMLATIEPHLGDVGVNHFDYILSARPEFLDMALRAVKDRYHSIDTWLEQEFALTAEKRAQLQARYLQD